jgi:RNA polymerase sigma-70 factor, ECF subfamily
MNEDIDPRVTAASSGSQQAFAGLFQRWSRPVLFYLTGRLHRREDAEDALQATFLTAWRDLPRLRRPERFVPWLFRIAKSRAVDLARRRRLGLVALSAVDEPAAPLEKSDADAEHVRSVVERLQPRTRLVLLLRTVEGLSAEEIGRALGISASTVRRRHARALEHLRAALERTVDDER